MKNCAYLSKLTIAGWAFLLLGWFGCRENTSPTGLQYVRLSGPTMGTAYHIQYGDAEGRDFQPSIDSLLAAINLEVSTYIDSSTISRFNQAKDTFDLGFGMREYSKHLTDRNRHFFKNYLFARVLHERTNGFFEPTIMPLVNYWGFGYTEKKPVEKIDSFEIAKRMHFVGFDKVKMVTQTGRDHLLLIKSNPNTQLDFSAIAKGYAVDEVGHLLESRGIKDYLVEIGGETTARGLNSRGQIWSIGINTPRPDADFKDFTQIVLLKDQAIATSGNYRQFYEKDGQKFSHIINPKTGFPEHSDLLSVSVVADDCMTADGYATSFFVMGKEQGFELAQRLENIEALFIYSQKDGTFGIRMTDNFGKMLKHN